MITLDTNILVYAFRAEFPEHERARELLDGLRHGDAAWAVPGESIAAFLRLTTNPRTFRSPSPLDLALDFVAALRQSSSFLLVRPGDRHLGLFLGLLPDANCRGKLVPDAWLAALVIEHGARLWTCDRDFARFPGLDWVDPLRP